MGSRRRHPPWRRAGLVIPSAVRFRGSPRGRLAIGYLEPLATAGGGVCEVSLPLGRGPGSIPGAPRRLPAVRTASFYSPWHRESLSGRLRGPRRRGRQASSAASGRVASDRGCLRRPRGGLRLQARPVRVGPEHEGLAGPSLIKQATSSTLLGWPHPQQGCPKDGSDERVDDSTCPTTLRYGRPARRPARRYGQGVITVGIAKRARNGLFYCPILAPFEQGLPMVRESAGTPRWAAPHLPIPRRDPKMPRRASAARLSAETKEFMVELLRERQEAARAAERALKIEVYKCYTRGMTFDEIAEVFAIRKATAIAWRDEGELAAAEQS